MNTEQQDNPPPPEEKRSGCLRTLGIVLITVVVMGLVIGGWVKYNLYASQFKPTMLSQKERTILNVKLAQLDASAQEDYYSRRHPQRGDSGALEPEAYSEAGARREIELTEKELNAIIANEPEVARRVAIDLSDNLVSLKLVVPVDDDIIILGGKTLRLNVGLTMGYEGSRLVVALKGVSLGGIPLPSAWLGNIKNVNLVNEFGGDGGFWDLFAAGVRDVKVLDGYIRLRLRE